MTQKIAFIGGGNMASAIIGGLLNKGFLPAQIDVVEPFAETQQRLKASFGITAHERPGVFLEAAELVVWAVKPQVFKEAAQPALIHTLHALHLSVAAGIPSASIARWLGTERVVRSMPNTPALIGMGITGLYPRPEVTAQDRSLIEQVVATMGEFFWLSREDQLDAVTALSGSGPAYVFYFMEAMINAGVDMGLSPEQAQKLAVETFRGASALAHASIEPPEVLRQRVTSKGGTTYAALSAMEASHIKPLFMQAMVAAQNRAREMGLEFGE
jgi:pyrroline-5-carboxylate reductase